MSETPTAAEGWQTITDVNMARADFEKLMAEVRRDRAELEQLRRGTNAAVAAELRRIADQHQTSRETADAAIQDARNAYDTRQEDMWFGRSVALEATVELLRARADELDPPVPPLDSPARQDR